MDNFSDFVHVIRYLWRFHTGCKPSRLSRNFPGCPETFEICWKPSRLFKTFLDRNFLDCPETFETFQKSSRQSWNFPDFCYVLTWFWVNFVGTRKNFPAAQKLSCWQCQHANGVFLTLDPPIPRLPPRLSQPSWSQLTRQQDCRIRKAWNIILQSV